MATLSRAVFEFLEKRRKREKKKPLWIQKLGDKPAMDAQLLNNTVGKVGGEGYGLTQNLLAAGHTVKTGSVSQFM